MKVYIQFDFEGIAGVALRDNQDRNIPVILDRTRRYEIAICPLTLSSSLGSIWMRTTWRKIRKGKNASITPTNE